MSFDPGRQMTIKRWVVLALKDVEVKLLDECQRLRPIREPVKVWDGERLYDEVLSRVHHVLQTAEDEAAV